MRRLEFVVSHPKSTTSLFLIVTKQVLLQAGTSAEFSCAEENSQRRRHLAWRDARAGRQARCAPALSAPALRSASHPFVVGAAATFGRHPVDDLVGIRDVAGLAVHAV